MANPRKFSEKIALHAQKQAEETAAFEQIMREVGVAVPKGSPGMSPSAPQPVFNQSLLQPFHRGCGGSLPNVNQMAAYPLAHTQTVYQDQHGMVQGGQPAYSPDQRSSGFGPQRSPRSVCDHRRETSPYRSEQAHYRPVSPCRPEPTPATYSPPGQTFLSPPSDSGWRRTHSDSALHRTLQQSECYSPSMQRRAGSGSGGGGGLHEVPGSGGSSPAPPPGHWNPFDPKLGHVPVSGSPATDQRVPGPPISLLDGLPPLNGLALAGSLPDLTPGGFGAPQPPPRPPQDGDELSRTPPYSPVYPAPTSPGQQQPGHSIPARPTQVSQSHLFVPGGPADFLHPRKAVTVGSQSPGLVRKAPFQSNFGADSQQQQQQQQQQQLQQQQQQQPMSPEDMQEMMTAFRTPRYRPRSVSPQPFCQPGYSPPSPLDGSGFPSSPSSPAAQSPVSNNGFYSAPPAAQSPVSNNGFYSAPQARQMQQQFEQFGMGISATVSVPAAQPMLASNDMSQNSTPLTPTSSIPEITLSDFSSASGLMRDANDLLQGSSDNFDGEDLGELDLEGLQMLTNPDGHVIDASSDDYFRMESLGGP